MLKFLTTTAILFLLAASIRAQELEEIPLYDQPRYDLLTLDAANGNAVLKIHPLEKRQVPQNPPAGSTIRIRLFDRQDDNQYDVAWGSIAGLQLFEQLVLEQAEKLTAAGKLEQAYSYFAWLTENHPQLAGLEAARQVYLYQSAGAAFKEKQYGEALAILEELARLAPDYKHPTGPALLGVLSAVVDRLLADYAAREDFRGCRALLARLEKDYGEKVPAIDKRRLELIARAETLRDQARAALDQQNLRQAHALCRQMLNIWPEVSGGRELASEVMTKHPLVLVAVDQAFDPATGPLTPVAARRYARLTDRWLFELTGQSSEGGRYESPFVTLQESADRRRLLLHSKKVLTGYDLTQRFLQLADPASTSPLAGLVSAASVEDVASAGIVLRSPYLLPEALLQTAPFPNKPLGPYVAGAEEDSEQRFAIAENYPFADPGQPAEIVEKVYPRAADALQALSRGEVDVLAQVPPQFVQSLKEEAGITVTPYAFPTLHVLMPNASRPYPANALFRRALIYGIPRQALLRQTVLHGANIPGCRVISGPLPPGVDASDPLGYGYDAEIQPRPYDAKVALTLLKLAEQQIAKAAQEQGKEPPPMQLVLGHPAAETPRTVCTAIAAHLGTLGMPVEVITLADKERAKECDFVYVEAPVWEPLIDVQVLFAASPAGFASHPYLQWSLRRLAAVSTWEDARGKLLDLHRLAYDEAIVIPLWQMVNHAAIREGVQGFGGKPVTLYQNVEQWRVTPAVGGSP